MGGMESGLARVGQAIGCPSRAAMLNVLLDGAPHSAGELAAAAAVASGTASQHLSVLVRAGMVTAQPRGRHRYYRLTDRRVARALEQLCAPGDLEPVSTFRLSREQRRLRAARTCYDHLAGQLGVGIADRFLDENWTDAHLSHLTPAGVDALHTHFGIAPDRLNAPGSRRPLLRPCRDWTEQRDHLAGRVGTLIADAALSNGWVIRKAGSRGLTISAVGQEAFRRVRIHVHAGFGESASSR